MKESELAELNYTPVPVAKKFSESELLLKIRVEGYAIRFYPLIYDIFKDMDGKKWISYTDFIRANQELLCKDE